MAVDSRVELVERDGELAEIDRLLEAVRLGSGGLLLIEPDGHGSR